MLVGSTAEASPAPRGPGEAGARRGRGDGPSGPCLPLGFCEWRCPSPVPLLLGRARSQGCWLPTFQSEDPRLLRSQTCARPAQSVLDR